MARQIEFKWEVLLGEGKEERGREEEEKERQREKEKRREKSCLPLGTGMGWQEGGRWGGGWEWVELVS